MIKFFRSRLTGDAGDGMFIMGVLFVTMFMLLAGSALDITRAVMDRQTLTSMAQSAATYSIRHINARGSLNHLAAASVVNHYRDARFGQAVRGATSHCIPGNRVPDRASHWVPSHRTNRNEVIMGILLIPEDINVGLDPIARVNVDFDELARTPGVVRYNAAIRPDVGRRSVDSGMPAPHNSIMVATAPDLDFAPLDSLGHPLPGRRLDTSVNYASVAISLWDFSPNAMLGMFGMPCMYYRIDVASIRFADSEDFLR